jgi:hypothetical protein
MIDKGLPESPLKNRARLNALDAGWVDDMRGDYDSKITRENVVGAIFTYTKQMSGFDP